MRGLRYVEVILTCRHSKLVWFLQYKNMRYYEKLEKIQNFGGLKLNFWCKIFKRKIFGAEFIIFEIFGQNFQVLSKFSFEFLRNFNILHIDIYGGSFYVYIHRMREHFLKFLIFSTRRWLICQLVWVILLRFFVRLGIFRVTCIAFFTDYESSISRYF